MKRVLIFGINGFSGLHLWGYLRKIKGAGVFGTYHKKLNPFKKDLLKGCACFFCDIGEAAAIRSVLKKVQPQEIYFLSSFVTVAKSFVLAFRIYETNVLGAAKFFEACVTICPKAKILLAGSSEEYGAVPSSLLPIKEEYPLSPVNPYGLSKMLQEEMAGFYYRSYGLDIASTRTFHFTGPMQPQSFVISDFANQIVQIEKGYRKPVIYTGDLRVKRDFTDIRDVVRAYDLMMKKAPAGSVFNVCSGGSVSIESILNDLLSKARVKIAVQEDPQKIRKSDVFDFRGDHGRLTKVTGWQPGYSLDQTLNDVLEWWRHHPKGLKGR